MNYGTLKSLIQHYAENDETSWVANIPEFIKIAESRIWSELGPIDALQLVTKETGQVTTSNRNLALSSSSPIDIKSFFVSSLATGPFEAVGEKDASFIGEAYGDTTITGKPRYYAKATNSSNPSVMNIIMAPTPDAAYFYEIEVFARPVSITTLGDSDSSWLSEMMPDAILFGSLVAAYTAMKGEQDIMATYVTMYDSALSNAKMIISDQNFPDSYRTGQPPEAGS